ncbi:hypothetical protein [Telmatospirillum sp. J64-1]|uniref:hypothetical protein n=1 Tax=Telmatospirillum sp. J64-1 TaxID=2502183 RepID=UPI00163D50CF|nr:hypothetical protein [Telmatospirillum sp. J64-1]
MSRKFTFRLDSEGVEELRKALTALGQDGEKAFALVRDASPRFANALTTAERAADRAGKRINQMGREATPAMKALRQASDEVTGSLKSMAGSLGAVGSGLVALGPAGVGAAAVIGGVMAALSKGVSVAEQFEQAGLKTEAILRATGYASGHTAESIRQMSREIALGTLASTQGVEAAAQRLMTFRSVGADVFRRTLEAAQDLAAAGFGTLESNAVQLGKALENPTRGLSALSESGVSFTAQQKEMIQSLEESGRVLEAQKLILEAVEGQVGGTGAAAGKGLSGAFDTLGQSIEEFYQKIGDAGSVQRLADVVNALALGVQQLDALLFVSQEKDIAARLEAADRAAEEQLRRLETVRSKWGTESQWTQQAEMAYRAARKEAEGLREELLGIVGARNQAEEAARRAGEEVQRRIAEEKRLEAERRAAEEAAKKAAQEQARAEAEAQRIQAHRASTIQGITESLDAELEKLELQNRYYGDTTGELEVHLQLLDIRGKLEKAGVENAEAWLEVYEGQVRAIHQGNRAHEQRKKTDEELRNARRQLEEERIRQSNRATDEVVDYGAKIFDDFFSGQRRGWASLADDILGIMRRTFAQIAAEAIIRPVIAPVMAGTMGGGMQAVGGQIVGGGPGMAVGGGSGGIGSLTSLGSSLAGGMQSAMMFDLGQSAALSGLGQGLGLSSGGYLTNAGVNVATGLSYTPWGIVGGLGANLLGLGHSNQLVNMATGGLGSVGGAIAGTSLAGTLGMSGSVLGPIGAIAGAFLGTALGGLFGKKGPKHTAATTLVGLSEDGPLSITGHNIQKNGGGVRAVTDALSEAYIEALNKVSDSLGLTLTEQAATSFTYVGRYKEYYTGGKQYETAEDALMGAINGAISKGGFSSDDPLVAKALANSKAQDLEALASDVLFAQGLAETIVGLNDLRDTLSGIERQAKASITSMKAQLLEEQQRAKDLGLSAEYMEALNGKFESWLGQISDTEVLTEAEKAIAALQGQIDGLREVAEATGAAVSEADLAEAQAKALAALRDGFNTSIADQILALTDPIALQLRQLEEAQALRLREAEALGADLVEVERLNGLERQKLLEQQGKMIQQQAQGLKDWLDRQLLGDLSSLTLSEKIEEAQRQFDQAVSAARAGDAAALGSLPQLADTLLRLGREGYSSSVTFAGLEQFIRSQMESLLGSLPGYAVGTLSAAPGLAWVGERGPELVSFRGGERVFTAAQSAAMTDNSAVVRAIWDSNAAVVAELVNLRREIVDMRREQQLAGQRQRIAGRA